MDPPAHRCSTQETQEYIRRCEADQRSLVKHANAHSRKQHHQAAHPTWPARPGHHAETRHPGKADAAQARASELAGAERVKIHSRGTRTTPHNLASSRGEVAERQRWKGGTLSSCERRLLDAFQQRELRIFFENRFLTTGKVPRSRSLVYLCGSPLADARNISPTPPPPPPRHLPSFLLGWPPLRWCVQIAR